MDTTPIIQVVERLVCEAVACQASDVYFEPDNTGVRVRFRVDGRLVEKKRFNGSVHEAVVLHFRTIANLIEPATPQPQERLIRLLVNGRTVEFRVFILPGVWGEMITLQATDPERLLYGLECLGLTLETLTQLRGVIRRPKGLFLVAGPARNGKRTTLYAMLRDCYQEDVQICTVEDDILCRVPGINQFVVPWGSAHRPATTLQYVLQQHPDIIMVNEIRDLETALLCIKAATSGMKVFAGIQASNVISAVDRLLKLGVPAYGLSDALNGILAVHLVPKICAHCKEADIPYAGTLSYLQEKGYSAEMSVFRGSGCHHCRQTGYAGHIGIQELIEIDQDIRRDLLQGKGSQEFRSWYESKKHHSLLADGLDKAVAGLVVLDDVIYSVATR